MKKTNTNVNRVRLRLFKDKDLMFTQGLLCDDTTRRYFPMLGAKTGGQAAITLDRWLEDKRWGYDLRYVIEDNETRTPVGVITGTYPKDEDTKTALDLAVLVHPAYRGQGYAKDGILAYIKKMKRMKPEIKKYRMIIEESNKSSQAVAKKLEFTLKETKISERTNTEFQYWEDR